MKKPIILAFALFLCSIPAALIAQDTGVSTSAPRKEIGLIFSSFDTFGFTYRFGTDRALWRLSAVSLRGGSNTAERNEFIDRSNSFGFGLDFGREFRKPLTDDFTLRYGFDVSFQVQHSKTERESKVSGTTGNLLQTTSYGPGFQFVVGANYAVGQHFVVGAEMLPGIDYRTGKQKTRANGQVVDSNLSNWSYGLSSSSVLLSLAYRF